MYLIMSFATDKYQTGPAPLVAIRHGSLRVWYNTGKFCAYTNGDVLNWMFFRDEWGQPVFDRTVKEKHE